MRPLKRSLEFILLSAVADTVIAHSWAACVDWNPTTSSCGGYIRNWYTQPSNPFYQDLGWDRRPGVSVAGGGLFCDTDKQRAHANVADGYSSDYPMAVYSPGQDVTILWPAKNHATVGADRGVQLFIGRGPGLGDDFSHISSKDAWIAQYPNLEQTFSNCEPNQAGVDTAPCTGTFTLPSDLEEGVYSFIWWWEFNAGEFYSSCYDARITSSDTGDGSDSVSVGDSNDSGSDGEAGNGDDSDPCIERNIDETACPNGGEPGFDGVSLQNAPAQIDGRAGSSFDVTISYDFSEDMYVIPDVFHRDGTFLGGGLDQGVLVQQGSGNRAVPVTIRNTATSGSADVQIWHVRSLDYSSDSADEPWNYELGRRTHVLALSTSQVACAARTECQSVSGAPSQASWSLSIFIGLAALSSLCANV